MNLKRQKIDEIYFNSKSRNKYRLLSNFYGGAEICYMAKRFKDPRMKKFILSFNNLDTKQFIGYLKLLQPEKKWTEKKEKYWLDSEHKPIRGILAKLVGSIVKKTPIMKRRAKIISQHLRIPLNNVFDSRYTTDEDMKECLKEKYILKKFREILLGTENAILHEKPLRGKGDAWTFPGGDKLGKMLMEKEKIYK